MAKLSNQETDLVEAARERHDEAFEQTQAWAKINSGSRNLEGLAKVADEIASAFADLPGQIDLVDPDPVMAIDEAGEEYRTPNGQHLHVKVRPDAPVQLLFTGHMDTVFAVDHPFQDLEWREEGKVLNGPGVTDMKGGIAVMLAALKALEHSTLADRFGYEVVINSDEEIGSASSAALLVGAAKGKRAAFTYEPSALPDGTLAGARSGSGNYSITIRGRSAHAGRNPLDGRNALIAAADLALRLKAEMDETLTVNPARIDGGGPNNVVPDLAILRVNFRCVDLDGQARAEKLVADFTAEIAAEHDVGVDVHGGFGRPPKPMTPPMEELFNLVKQAGADLGQDIGWKATGGVCDGNNIAATGVPVVDTMGVRGGAIHSHDEFLIVESIGERAALSALTVARLISS